MLVEEFLLGEDKLEHGTAFFNHSKNSCKEGHIKTTGRFSFAFGSSSLFQIVVVLTMHDARETKADRTNSGLLMYTANMATVHEVVTQYIK